MDKDCEDSEQCHNETCVDACSDRPCAANATCSVQGHRVICDCPSHLQGDPYGEKCNTINCSKNSDCAYGGIVKCSSEGVCEPSK